MPRPRAPPVSPRERVGSGDETNPRPLRARSSAKSLAVLAQKVTAGLVQFHHVRRLQDKIIRSEGLDHFITPFRTYESNQGRTQRLKKGGGGGGPGHRYRVGLVRPCGTRSAPNFFRERLIYGRT